MQRHFLAGEIQAGQPHFDAFLDQTDDGSLACRR